MKSVQLRDQSSKTSGGHSHITAPPHGRCSQAKRRFDIQEKETYQRLVRAIRCACPRWLGAQSEDLAQRAALKIVEQHSKGNIVEPMCSTYINRVAMSVVIDEIRSRRRKPQNNRHQSAQGRFRETELRSVSSIEQLPCQDTPETQTTSQNLGRAILGCLNRLIEDRRLAVTLGLQGYTVKEIAQTFDWSPKKAKNLYFRGRSDLQVCLRRKGFHVGEE